MGLKTSLENARTYRSSIQKPHVLLVEVHLTFGSVTKYINSSHYRVPRPTSASEPHKHTLALPSDLLCGFDSSQCAYGLRLTPAQ